MTFFCSLLLMGATAQGGVDLPSKKISFYSAAAPLERLLPELGKQAGFAMEAAPSTKDEVLVVRVKDQPLKTLMLKIAEIAHGEWTHDDEVYRFVRTQELERKMVGASRARILERIRFDRRNRGKYDAPTPEMTVAEAEAYVADEIARFRCSREGEVPPADLLQRQIRHTPPAHRLYAHVLMGMPENELAAVELGERVVFSSKPNRMQRRLPAALKPYLKQYVSDRARVARAASAYSEDDTRNTGLMPTTDTDADRLLVSVTRREGRLRVGVYVLGPNGEHMGEAEGEVGYDNAPGWKLVSDKKLRYSDKTERAFGAIRSSAAIDGSSWMKRYDLPTDLMDEVLDPCRFEPLAGHPTDEIVALADAVEAPNIVAVIPDEALSARKAAESPRTIDDVGMQFVSSFGMDLKTADGWLTLDYALPDERNARRTPRAALRDLFQAYRSAGRLDIDTAAAFLVRCRDVSPAALEAMVQSYPDAALRTALWRLEQRPGSDLGMPAGFLAFYGSLSEQQRTALLNGKELQWEYLSKPQRQMLLDEVFGAYPSFHFFDPEPANPRTDRLLTREPTECLPDGIPLGTVVKAEVAAVTGYVLKGSTDGVPMDAFMVANRLFLETIRSDKTPPPERLYKAIGKFKLSYRIALAPHVVAAGYIEERRVAADKEARPLSQLPKAFRDEVERNLARLLPKKSK